MRDIVKTECELVKADVRARDAEASSEIRALEDRFDAKFVALEAKVDDMNSALQQILAELRRRPSTQPRRPLPAP